jgi:hypothetical protein
MTNTLYPNESSLRTMSSCRMQCTRKSIRQDSPSLSFEKLSISCCLVNSARMPNSNKVLLHQKNAKWKKVCVQYKNAWKNVVQNFSGGCNACVWSFQKHSVWLQNPLVGCDCNSWGHRVCLHPTWVCMFAKTGDSANNLYSQNIWLHLGFVSGCKQLKYVIANMQLGKKELHLISVCDFKQIKKVVGATCLKRKRDIGLFKRIVCMCATRVQWKNCNSYLLVFATRLTTCDCNLVSVSGFKKS